MRPGPPSLSRVFLAAGVALSFLPGAASGQDVIEAGRAHGVVPTGPLARRAAADPTMFEFRRAWRQRTERVRAARAALERREGPRLSVSRLQAASAAVTGTMRVPVIAARYSDVAEPFPTADYQNRLFGEAPGGYSAKTFYRELSRNAFTMDGTVTPWVALPQGRGYYEPSQTTDPDFGRIDAFLVDALTAADPGLDFGLFDSDGPDGVPNSGDDDGYVDAAAFIYPAAGRSCGGPGIWPHRWTVQAATGSEFTTNDPRAGGGFIVVDDYLIQGGLECQTNALMSIGTFSHEMGHALGLPDLYDTAGDSEGVGEWDLMGSGNYRLPFSPAHMGAWSKDFLGWVNVETITASRPTASLSTVYDGTVWRYSIPATQEYFLMEHRRNLLSDGALHEPGMLIWHIDPEVIEATRHFNRVNAGEVHGVALEEADGMDHLAHGNNRGDAGDPFPGGASKLVFSSSSYPASNANDGTPSGLQLSGIALNTATVDFNMTIGAVLVADTGIAMVAQAGATVQRGTAVSIAGGPSQVVTLTEDAAWLTVSPASGPTPLGVVLTANTAGLAEGTYRTDLVISSPAVVNSGRRMRVTLQVGRGVMAVGDSLASTLGAAGERDTAYVDLVAGQPVDVGIFSRSTNAGFDPSFDVIDPAGGVRAVTLHRRASPRSRILARFVPATTGTHRFVIRDGAASEVTAPLEYILRSRPSGPVVAAEPGYAWAFGGEGDAGPLSTHLPVTVMNHGSGTGSFSAATGTAWLSVSPSGGTVTATAGAAAPNRPAGTALLVGESMLPRPLPVVEPAATTVDLVVTAQPAGRSRGVHTGSVDLQLPADVWNGAVALPVDMRLHDASSTVLTRSVGAFRGAAVAPDGFVVVGDGAGVLHRVDPTSGAATAWLTRPGVYGMEFGADSALYLAEGPARRVSRVAADGTVTELFTTAGIANDVAVMSDGTVFASAGDQLLRWRPGEAAPTEIARATGRPRFALAIAYHLGSIYFAEASRFRRVDLATGQEHDLGGIPTESNRVLLNLSVGRSGRFYGMENSVLGGVLVYDASGALVERLWPTDVGYGTAIAEGALYGTGYLRDVVWKLPLDDGPAPRDVLMGDASGDGQITVSDAVGVLSQVVGRPLPDGWSATAGDANCDSQTTAFDALVILSRIVGKDVSTFCVGTRR